MKKIILLMVILTITGSVYGCGSKNSPSPTAVEEAGIKAEKKAKDLTGEISEEAEKAGAEIEETLK